jgi:hypothetical protein
MYLLSVLVRLASALLAYITTRTTAKSSQYGEM